MEHPVHSDWTIAAAIALLSNKYDVGQMDFLSLAELILDKFYLSTDTKQVGIAYESLLVEKISREYKCGPYSAKKELAYIKQKQQHGCQDAYCAHCDKDM